MASLSNPIEKLRALRVQIDANALVIRTLANDLLLAQRARDPKHILQAATHVYSQNYEDAIIAEIFARIGERSRVFVEIGVQDGVECNTRALLERGWTGLWVDADKSALDLARANMAPFVQSGALKIVTSMATTSNIQSLIQDQIGAAPIDLLSVDVDYNTSHIWRAIQSRSRVACVEYNASHPPVVEWEVAYDPDKAWDGTNHFGASLKTLEIIGKAKKQALVGCDFHGVNAFFVDIDEVGDRFLTPFTAEQHFEPPRYTLIGHRGHRASTQAAVPNIRSERQ